MEKRKGLPMELVMEILLKMPTRAVLRFSCVSKAWHNLIMQDEYFGDLHLQRSPHEFNPTYLFFYYQYLFVDDIGRYQQLNVGMSISNSLTHNIIKLHRNPLVVKPGFRYSKEYDDLLLPYDYSATCNGLLCLVPSLDERNDPILLCNPITAEYLKLPPLNIKKIIEYDVGLGFAPFSEQYKVVCLLSSYMWVHTVGADRSWRKIKMNEQDFVTNSSSILYLDGKIYYLVERTGPGLKFKKSTMVEFDVESEKAIMLDHAAFPNHCRFSDDDQLVNLPSCGGKGLSLFTIKQEKSSSVVDVWVLKEDYRWDLRHQINFPQNNQSDKPGRRMVSVWELVDGDILIFLSDNLMVRYNKHTRITITEQLPELRFYTSVKGTWCVCHGYNPSLVSLKKYGSTQTERLSSSDDKSLPPTPRIQLPPTLNN